MGGGQTKIVTENNHCDFYYKGKAAVKEGRYTNAELYFQQALSQHAGRPFWDTLLQGVFKKDTINKREGLGDKDVLSLVDELNEEEEEISQGNVSKSHKSQPKKNSLILPTDKNVVPVLDYIRLCMDISLCYLTQPGDEKNGRIAMLYSGFVSIALQVLWAFLYTWIAKKEEEQDDTATVAGEEGENQSQKSKKQKSQNGEEEIKKDTEKNVLVKFSFGHNAERPSEKEINDWIHRLIPFIRYYWHSATTNYSVLVLLFANELDPTDIKRRKIITQNIIDMINKVQYDLLALAKQFPEGEAAQTMVKYMPSLNYELHRIDEFEKDNPSEEKKSGGASKSSAQSSKFYASFTSSGMGRQTFLSTCREFPITSPLMVDVNYTVDLDFNIDFDIPRKDLYRIQTPAERETCHYIQWYTAEQLIYVPGHNTHFLLKALPHYYTPPPNGPHSSLKILYRPLDNNMAKALLSSEAAERGKVLNSYETNVGTNKVQVIDKEGNLYVNSRLDLEDTLTLRKLGLEEAFVGSAALLVMNAKLLQKVGQLDRAEQFLNFTEKVAAVFYGRKSDEYTLLTGLQYTYNF